LQPSMDFTSPSSSKGHVVLQVVFGQLFGSGLWSVCCVSIRNRCCGLPTIYIGKWAKLWNVKILMQRKKNSTVGNSDLFYRSVSNNATDLHRNVIRMRALTSNKFYRFNLPQRKPTNAHSSSGSQ